jgi:hypothetical protein
MRNGIFILTFSLFAALRSLLPHQSSPKGRRL